MLVHIKCGDFQKEIFDEIEKNSIKLRNEECEHYYLYIKLSEGNNFEELILKIICKLCNNEKKWIFQNKENSINYCCSNCINDKISIYYIIQETNDVNKNIIDIKDNKENFNNNDEIKEEKKDINDQKEENIQINVDYRGNTKSIIFNSRDSFDNQYYKFFEIFGINNKKDLYFNSTKLDIYKSLKDNNLYNNCIIEIAD